MDAMKVGDDENQYQNADIKKNAQLPVCAEMFLKDLSLFVRRKPGQWLEGKEGMRDNSVT